MSGPLHARRRNATLSVLLACAVGTGAAFAGTAAAAPAPPSAAGMRASSIFGTTGTAPNSVVIDAAGNAYTANSGSDNVSMITPAGVSTILGTTGKMPMGIALDSAGNVYTSNIGENTVTKITPAGASTTLGTTGNKPMGIKVDSAGNVYTTNYIDSTVTKITPAGESSVLAATGRHPLGIVLDASGNVYTANEATNTITKITPAGVASTLGKTGGWPQAIAMDGSGNLYTANWNTKNVSKVTPKGVSKILGSTGRRPIGITVDTSGNVYTTNNGADSVSRVTQSGQSRIIATTGRRPSGMTIDSSGNLYVANFLSNSVSRISASAATRSNTVSLSTVTVGSPKNAAAWIIPFYNDVYQTQASCEAALPGVTAFAQTWADPAVQAVSATSCMGIGGVDYTYNVGETELTTAQWVTFLNTADPMGLNRHHLWDASEGGQVWAKYGSISRNPKAAPGQRYYVTSPAWANKPYNTADFSRSARFVNSLQNGKVLSKKSTVVTTVSGTPLKTTTYTVRLSPKTETGQYTMSNRKATRNLKSGFAVTSQDEWVKAAYFDPNGGGKFSYWDYPTNPGAADEWLAAEIGRAARDPGALAVFQSVFYMPRPRALDVLLVKEFGGPCLLLQGGKDPLNDAKGRARALEEAVPGIEVRLLDAGHCPHDEKPAEVAEAVAAFAARCFGGEGGKKEGGGDGNGSSSSRSPSSSSSSSESANGSVVSRPAALV